MREVYIVWLDTPIDQLNLSVLEGNTSLLGNQLDILLLYFGIFDVNSIIVSTLAVTYQANFHKRKPSYVCMYVVMNEQSVSDYWSYCMLICAITCEHNCWGWIIHFEEDPSQGLCRKKVKALCHFLEVHMCVTLLWTSLSTNQSKNYVTVTTSLQSAVKQMTSIFSTLRAMDTYSIGCGGSIMKTFSPS